MAGQRPFPRYSDVPLPPERQLLHELIVQVVTERRVDADHVPGQVSEYDARLAVTIKNITASETYQRLAAQGNTDRAAVTALLDAAGVERLPSVDADQRVTLMMATGGPGTGKSKLVTMLEDGHPEIYRDAAKVNTDDYKLLLVDKDQYGPAYAGAAHAESALVCDKILERLSEKIAAGEAPHVILDVVTLTDQRMAFAHQSGQLIVATGTVPPEEAVRRSYERGLATERVVPTEAVLAGAKVVAETTPRLFDHPQAEMTLYDTDVPQGTPARVVAEWKPEISALVIRDPDTFVDFVERQNLNAKATSPDQLFTAADRTPERIAGDFSAYTERGVTLAFLDENGELAMTIGRDGVEERLPLSSRRGAGFFTELASASRAAIDSRRSPLADERTTPTHDTQGHPATPSATRGAAVATGIGVGLGVKGIYDELTEDTSPLYRDLNAGGGQAAVGAARFATQAADVVIGGAAAVEGARRAMASAASALADAGPVAGWAGRAAVPLAIAAGTLEATAGIIEDNPERVAGAVGSTGGGLLGGILAGAAAGGVAGAITGSPGGPVAMATAFVGGLGGAVAGAYYGEEAAKEWLTDAVDTAMHPLGEEAPPQEVAPFPLTAEMMHALSAVRGITLAPAIRCGATDEVSPVHGLPPGLTRSPSHDTGMCR